MIRALGRIIGRVALVGGIAGAALWAFGPYEPVDFQADFDPRRFGEGVQVYFESIESQFKDITPGVEKRVIWRDGFKEQRTPYSVLYVHGFSATSEEIRPVPDRVADALSANLVYTRLAGHGRGSAPMAGPTVNHWMQDVAEGLEAARAVGDRVVVMATSTGATLVTAALADPKQTQDVAAVIMVSPNYAINDPAAFLLTWPAARYWVPLAVGETRTFKADSDAHATYWTTSYPVTALMPLAALVKSAAALDLSGLRLPLLVHLSDADQVVRPDITREVLADWGGPTVFKTFDMEPGDDASAHVITGDIQSPGQTDASVASMVQWLSDMGIK